MVWTQNQYKNDHWPCYLNTIVGFTYSSVVQLKLHVIGVYLKLSNCPESMSNTCRYLIKQDNDHNMSVTETKYTYRCFRDCFSKYWLVQVLLTTVLWLTPYTLFEYWMKGTHRVDSHPKALYFLFLILQCSLLLLYTVCMNRLVIDKECMRFLHMLWVMFLIINEVHMHKHNYW